MVPGNLRAGLQTFEGLEVNEIRQQYTYTMQHQPTKILPELKKLISFAYRRGLFLKRIVNKDDDFAIAEFLKDLLLENTDSPNSYPFVVEFCLMFPFRIKGDKISMISCDTLSSVFSKMASVCKAGVCSFICSFTSDAYSVHGLRLVHQIRDANVLNILSPIVRQIREMNGRIPSRRKDLLDEDGNIVVDQFFFHFDDWSNIIPRTLALMKSSISKLAIGDWWETILDVSSPVRVEVDDSNADLRLIGITPVWNSGENLPLDELDSFTAMIEMAFHGFGGGSARFTELETPTMFHCLFVNQSIYSQKEICMFC